MSRMDMGLAKPVQMPFEVVESSPGRNALMGLIFGFSLAAFLASVIWLFLDFVMPMFQLGLVLGTFIVGAISGFLYFLSPARSLAFFLVGLSYFLAEATLRSSGTGDLQSVVKGGLALVLAGLAFFSGFRFVLRHPISLVLFLYAVLAAASAAYSPMLVVGLVAGISVLGETVLAGMVGQGGQKDVKDYWQVLYWASALTAVLSLLAWAAFPNVAIDMADFTRSRLKGITGSPNALGPLMANAIILGLFMVRRSTKSSVQYLHWALLVVFAATLLLTNSRGAIVGLWVALFASWLLNGRMGVMGTLFVALGLVVLGTVMVYPDLQEDILRWLAHMFARTGHVSELTSLTGRGVIWEAAWRLIQKSPWIGYGMSSMVVVLPEAYADQWGNVYTTAHNMVLESLISVGWVGTIPLLLVTVMAFRALLGFLWRRRRVISGDRVDHDLAICAFRVLVMLMVFGITEKSFGGQPGSTYLALCGVVATSVYLAKKYVARAAPAEGKPEMSAGRF